MLTAPLADVAIIGAGFSGTGLAIHLAQRVSAPARIALVGDAASFGRGLAYATRDPDHLLNVPAGNMSLFPDQPDDFVQWHLAETGEPADIATAQREFAPRRDYARYLADRLAATAAQPGRATIEQIPASVTRLRRVGDHWRLALDTGAERDARAVVLATGHLTGGLPLPATAIDPGAAARIVAQPLAVDWAAIAPAAAVLLIGTGLTMIDQVITLDRRGHRGPIVALSRRGLLPQPHLTPHSPAAPAAWLPPETDLLTPLAAWRAARAGHEWRALLDGLRPVTAARWHGLTAAERRRFVRHLAPYWNVHRHRMAPTIAARVERLQMRGQLMVIAGRLRAIECQADRLAVRVQLRHTAGEQTFAVDWIVNCTGPERLRPESGNPLLTQLIADRIVTSDPVGLGVRVSDADQVLDAGGDPTPGLFAVGPLTTGRWWEITAVPDIRVQLDTLARHLQGLLATV